MDQMKKYLQPSSILAVVGVIVLIFGIVTVIEGWIGLLFLAVGGLLVWLGISNIKDFHKILNDLTQSGQIQYVIEDFSGSVSMIKDYIRVGKRYLFGKKSGLIVAYGDIKKIYQHIHKTNGIEDRRELRYVDIHGRTHTLCSLLIRDKSKDELIQLLNIILQKNPNVQIGY